MRLANFCGKTVVALFFLPAFTVYRSKTPPRRYIQNNARDTLGISGVESDDDAAASTYEGLVLVVVVAVGSVAVLAVDVIHVIAVLNGLVAAAFAVNMAAMALGGHVSALRKVVLVVVVAVDVVEVAVVEVVNVTFVVNLGVAAIVAVNVGVIGMNVVAHDYSSQF